MVFENTQINVNELPSIESVEFQKLAPSYLKASYVGNAIFFGLLLIGLVCLFIFTDLRFEKVLPFLLPTLWLIWTVIAFMLAKKSFNIAGYAIRDKDIIYRKGIIFRSLTTIPFNRVQHCEVKQGPVERYFGLNTLEVYTAGGQSSDLSIPGLLPDEAQSIKDFIIGKTTDIDVDL